MRVLYDEWAGEHDQVLQAFGYSYLPVIAGLVARYVRELDAPILDATGIVGEVLSIFGYTRLTGIDLSDGKLAVARAKAAYAKLKNETLGERLDYADDAFAAVLLRRADPDHPTGRPPDFHPQPAGLRGGRLPAEAEGPERSGALAHTRDHAHLLLALACAPSKASVLARAHVYEVV